MFTVALFHWAIQQDLACQITHDPTFWFLFIDFHLCNVSGTNCITPAQNLFSLFFSPWPIQTVSQFIPANQCYLKFLFHASVHSHAFYLQVNISYLWSKSNPSTNDLSRWEPNGFLFASFVHHMGKTMASYTLPTWFELLTDIQKNAQLCILYFNKCLVKSALVFQHRYLYFH